MTRLESYADLAVGFETTDARTMAGTRINYDEGPPLRIDLSSGRRNDAHQRVIHRSIELAAVNQKLGLIVEHMRSGFLQMLAILIATLAHNVPEQNAALRGVDHVFDGGAEHIERQGLGFIRVLRRGCLWVGAHVPKPSLKLGNEISCGPAAGGLTAASVGKELRPKINSAFDLGQRTPATLRRFCVLSMRANAWFISPDSCRLDRMRWNNPQSSKAVWLGADICRRSHGWRIMKKVGWPEILSQALRSRLTQFRLRLPMRRWRVCRRRSSSMAIGSAVLATPCWDRRGNWQLGRLPPFHS